MRGIIYLKVVNPSSEQLEHGKERCFVAVNVKLFGHIPQKTSYKTQLTW